jgi:hypothetical protein
MTRSSNESQNWKVATCHHLSSVYLAKIFHVVKLPVCCLARSHCGSHASL